MSREEAQNNCIHHGVIHEKLLTFRERIESIEEENEKMRIDIETLKNNTWSPSVLIAIVGLFGTALTVLGGLAGVAMSIFAKAHGWG